MIINLTSGPHSKAEILAINTSNGFIDFRWLDENNNPIDQGISTKPMSITELPITEDQLRAAIEAE